MTRPSLWRSSSAARHTPGGALARGRCSRVQPSVARHPPGEPGPEEEDVGETAAAVAHLHVVRVQGLEAPVEVADFIPPTYPLEIELQDLVAVAECTSRELLPPNLRALERDVITRRIHELKALLDTR
jgi:hypothetical protein